MKPMRYLGGSLIAAPFVFLFVSGIGTMGLVRTLISFGGAIVMVAIVAIGVALFVGDGS